MTSPFTFTPGRAGQAYIDMHYADEIIRSFNDEISEKYVYKILGLRGSGKSVVYSKILEAMREDKKWLVYTISAGGNPLSTLIGMMSKEKFISEYEKSYSFKAGGEVGGGVAFLKGSGSLSGEMFMSPNTNYYSQESTLKEMIAIASQKGYRVLIGIDDIVKSKDMTAFLSLLGDMILDSTKHVYLVCTGLSKNIEDFVSEPHLSFFVRSDKIEIKHLSLPQMAYKYKSLLNIPADKARDCARFTKGYAYAYQVLGELLYRNNITDISYIMDEFDAIIADQYDIIWNSLTNYEKNLAKIIINSSTGKADEIKKLMDNPSGYPVLRSRLIKKHIVTVSDRTIMSVNLPRIKEYIELWQ